MRTVLRWGSLCIGIAAPIGSADAQQAPQAVSLAPDPGDRHRREIVVLTSTHQPDRNSTVLDFVHELAEMPLNHLGMVVRPHDIRRGAPSGIEWSRVRAVVTWFLGDEEDTPWLWPWLFGEVRGRDVRIVHLDDFGPLEREPERLREWLANLGLGFDSGYVAEPFRVEVDFGDRALSCYEATHAFPRTHAGPWSRNDANRVWVATRDQQSSHRARTPVVTGPWGGIALQPYLLRVGGPAHDRRWFVDPFAFFAAALGLDAAPAPDPSVLNGRRMFLLHVDGDGFESVSSTAGDGERDVCGAVFLRRIVDRYELPMTVSVIVASLTDDIEVADPTPGMEIARRIFEREWVEAASHSVLHPLDWRKRRAPRSLPRSVTWYPGLRNYEHDMVAEVRESIRFVDDHLLPRGKRCRVMLWSGGANPRQDAIAAAADAGCWNLNGGVYRWDDLTNSVGFVPPWGKAVGEAFQVYCGAPNENVYEGFFTSMPGAFRHVEQTIERTGRGRILKPANLYVHFYSVENPVRLSVLEHLIERWGLREPTAPVFASTYAAAVEGARSGEIFSNPRGWSFRDFGGCRSVRFDGEPRSVDFGESTGVLGARRIGDRLWVHLATPDADVVLNDRPRRYPHVEHANHLLRDVVVRPDGIDCRSMAYSRRVIVFAGLPPAAELTLRLDGAPARLCEADRDGRFELELPTRGDTQVRLSAR